MSQKQKEKSILRKREWPTVPNTTQRSSKMKTEKSWWDVTRMGGEEVEAVIMGSSFQTICEGIRELRQRRKRIGIKGEFKTKGGTISQSMFMYYQG